MRQVFQDFMKKHWDYEIDPMDDRLEVGHLWDWGYYLEPQPHHDVCEEDFGMSWQDYLSHLDWLELIIPCYTNNPYSIVYAQMIKAGMYDLVHEPYGIRLEVLLNLN